MKYINSKEGKRLAESAGLSFRSFMAGNCVAVASLVAAHIVPFDRGSSGPLVCVLIAGAGTMLSLVALVNCVWSVCRILGMAADAVRDISAKMGE